MKIVFMGTPEFAVPSLNILNNSEHEVVAVYTQAPKPAGRGHKLQLTPINKLANEFKLLVEAPKSLKKEEEWHKLASFKADIAIVAAYGLILPKEILSIFKYGCINIHPSLLPRWRGAAPIHRTVLAGDAVTAVCIMKMDEGLDTGDILLIKKFKLSDDITSGQLHDLAAKLGAEMMIKTLANISSITPIKQSNEGVTYAHKLCKEEFKLSFEENADAVERKIRGLNPWPGAYFNYQGEKIKILKAKYDMEHITNSKPAIIVDNNLSISCKKGVIMPKLVQKAGKNIMQIEEFLKGFSIKLGTKIL